MIPVVGDVRVEHHREALGIGEVRPRLSWTTHAPRGWVRTACRVELVRAGRTNLHEVATDDSVLVEWPGEPLSSRESVQVRVQVAGTDCAWSELSDPLDVEAGLLGAEDWVAEAIAPDWAEDHEQDNPPPLLRKAFTSTGDVSRARLYVTAHGLYEIEINGRRVGAEALAPGWTVYPTRLRYATYDVTDALRDGANAIGAWLADGWYRGRIGFEGGTRNIYGNQLALLAQLEIGYTDGRVVTIATDDTWEASTGPIRFASLYDGERYDARREHVGFSTAGFDAGRWAGVRRVHRDPTTLVPADGPPVRCTGELAPASVARLEDGTLLLDFGQNISGRLRITVTGDAGATVRIRHAEVLQGGRIYTRPLRAADATDEYVLRGGEPETWEPRFTIHGFRYAEISGWVGTDPLNSVTARVYHSDFERTGWFSCSDERLNRLHENVRWSMRGNMVDIPTDCPQRDERLGWTGDIQVFAPTAAFLYDCSGFLASWLKDLAAEQLPDGTVPWYVPVVPGGDVWTPARPGAAWGDAAVLVPWALWEAFADRDLLERQYDSAAAWVALVGRLSGADHLWDSGFQLGDWLDPAAPPDDPAGARTDRYLVATAYAARSAQRLADTAKALGRTDEAERIESVAAAIRNAFRHRHLTAERRLTSDAPTAYALAIAFDLVDTDTRPAAGNRLAELVHDADYTIATGFVGTPLVCGALSSTGHVESAYRLLLNDRCPSWLYSVAMGATTVWERWDSMLPDGTVNPGDMTSFNHYALGAVAEWLHRVVAGIAPREPGYRSITFAPVPGGGISSASATHVTPYGTASIAWTIEHDMMETHVVVPVGATGCLTLPGHDEFTIGHGSHAFRIPVPT